MRARNCRFRRLRSYRRSPAAFPQRPAAAMLALRCGPRLLGLLPVPRSAPLRLPALRACSSSSGGGGSRDASSSSRNPLVYLDVGADGQPLGRVVLEVSVLHRAAPDWAWGTGPALCPTCWVTLPLTPGHGPQFPHP